YGDHRAADGISERFGRHQPDAQPGVAARSAVDDHTLYVARPPALRFEKRRDGRRQVARMPPRFVKRADSDKTRPFRDADLTGPARRFYQQPSACVGHTITFWFAADVGCVKAKRRRTGAVQMTRCVAA